MFIFLPIKNVYVPIDRVGFLSSRGFPGGPESEESACNAGDVGSIPRSGRSPGEENGYPLQCSCLENPWAEELVG